MSTLDLKRLTRTWRCRVRQPNCVSTCEGQKTFAFLISMDEQRKKISTRSEQAILSRPATGMEDGEMGEVRRCRSLADVYFERSLTLRVVAMLHSNSCSAFAQAQWSYMMGGPSASSNRTSRREEAVHEATLDLTRSVCFCPFPNSCLPMDSSALCCPTGICSRTTSPIQHQRSNKGARNSPATKQRPPLRARAGHPTKQEESSRPSTRPSASVAVAVAYPSGIALPYDVAVGEGTILKATVDYVKTLKRENDRMIAIEERQKFLENQNKQLMIRIHQLEVQSLRASLLRQPGIVPHRPPFPPGLIFRSWHPSDPDAAVLPG
ncbi:microphthalmia-associated transcription factor-like [Tropilaelaps mercedesae]|uniref:Microphthalmia-associated transcription factor-like n=1 Tax=Tropilaelaps mercedesae TaxID=418985 RepID=A0A1V9XBN0_9ACAR|nr:microphthalmia-associated transcription factor-like [Tropilaelaps mercedesae]